MHAVTLLHNFIKKSCTGIHLKRLNALFVAVEALLIGCKLSVAGMGRSLHSKAKTKHDIKRVDRLLSNKNLHKERKEIYGKSIFLVAGNIKKLPIILDWTALPDFKHYVLRASVPTKGRSFTIYEEVYCKSKQNNIKVYKNFLKTLKTLLPVNYKPIVITDAGFHSPFFKEVEKLKWDWIGRVRGKIQYRYLNSRERIACATLHENACWIPKFVSEVILSKTNPIQCFLFTFKSKKKGRIAKNKHGKRRNSIDSKKCARANKEPWVLATSLKGGQAIAKKIIKLYKTRMQIEESFRDLKNSRFGFSLEESKTQDRERWEILLLIAMLAILVACLLGKAAERRSLQYEFQANTVKSRTVLSLFFLGCQIIKKGSITFTNQELKDALTNFKLIIDELVDEI